MAFLDYFKEDYIYDVKYALRVCIQEGKHEACVYIYSLLHLYEEAVKLALRVNLDLAKDAATKAEESVQKKLWLIIARYLIEVAVRGAEVTRRNAGISRAPSRCWRSVRC